MALAGSVASQQNRKFSELRGELTHVVCFNKCLDGADSPAEPQTTDQRPGSGCELKSSSAPVLLLFFSCLRVFSLRLRLARELVDVLTPARSRITLISVRVGFVFLRVLAAGARRFWLRHRNMKLWRSGS